MSFRQASGYVNAVSMNSFLVLASIAFFLSACAAETKVHQGRIALLSGFPTVALASFQSAAELDSNRLYFSVLPQGVWTYVGRADYAAGSYPERAKLWNARFLSTKKITWPSFIWA